MIVSLIWSQPYVRCVTLLFISVLFISQTKDNEAWLILASTSTQRENTWDAIRIPQLVCDGLGFAILTNGEQRIRC